MSWYQRADYRWLLLADPPVCRSGRPAVVLSNCDRLRRDEGCWCRFETQAIVEDLEVVGSPGAADDWLTTGDLESRDVEDLRDALAAIVRHRRNSGNDASLSDDARAALERLAALLTRLDRLVEGGSGLSDRYADDIDD